MNERIIRWVETAGIAVLLLGAFKLNLTLIITGIILLTLVLTLTIIQDELLQK